MKRFVRFVLLACLFPGIGIAQSTTIQTVKCDADTTQSYSITLPKNYNKSQSYPVLFLFDPVARGKFVVEHYQKATDYGFILIGSNNSRNGPMGVSLNAANALFTDAFKKCNINQSQVYLAGFSGGARVATTIALQSGGVAGVIACGAGFGEEIPKSALPFTFAGIAGTRDFNYVELQQTVQTIQSTGSKTNLQVFKGPHAWPPADVFFNALLWSYLQHQKPGMDNKGLPAITSLYEAKASADDIKKEAAYQQKISGAFQAIFAGSVNEIKSKGWWKSELSALNKILLNKVSADSDYVARQKAFIIANAGESFGNYYRAKRYDTAGELLTIAEVFEPENSLVDYRHALLAAADKNETQTLYYLKQAIQHGFPNKQQIGRETAFSFLSADKQFRALLN